MDNTTRKRTRKAGAPEVVALKKSVSAALKAAWHVEQVRARVEKPKRERNTLAKKVEAQRAALEKVKATVEGLLASLQPVQVDPLKDHPELPMQPETVVLEPSAAA
jgi:seryl-tRNA synthetase